MSAAFNYKQHFTQQVLQKYGWGCDVIKEDVSNNVGTTTATTDTDQSLSRSPQWKIRVTVAWNDVREFELGGRGQEAVTAGLDEKQVLNLLYKEAVEGVQQEIEKQEAKPLHELKDAFPVAMDIYASNRENWDYFWSHKPLEVGIDVEGNQIIPPVLVQISTTEYCILEVPQKGKGISKDLQRLLKDETIVKVFCDNFAHKDKKSLGITDYGPTQRTDMVELETAVSHFLGPSKSARGLARLVNLTMPELNMRVGKPKRTDTKSRFKNIGRFALIEQGKLPPLKSLQSLSYQEQQYAALDAYVTLLVYHKILEMRQTFSRE